MINHYEGFHNKMIQMLTQYTLGMERAIDKEVSMIDKPSKNKEVYRIK